MYSPNPRVPIALNADLIDWVDQILSDALRPELDHLSPELWQETIELKRIAAIETAVQHWCQQQNHQRLQRSADLHRQRHSNDETGWLV